jgi:Putative redox-active protein (C_GCAxxG_C_C)
MDTPTVRQQKINTPSWLYYRYALANLIRMGHCAPTVMKSILDITSEEKEWLIRLSAGMPGGIGNTGFECGGVTSPLVLLGLRFGLDREDHHLPMIFDKGHALCRRFLACHRTLQCREIRGKDHFPRHCIPPVLRSPGLFMNALNGNDPDGDIPPASRDALSKLYTYFSESHFHCAQSVLEHLGYQSEKDRELFDAVSAFIGGTLFMGKTCSAYTAGVMTIGLEKGEIEDSPRRVIRLLAIMTMGGYAFDEKINRFNRSMNQGYRLSKWFSKEFGSTQCRLITQCDFSDPVGVRNFIEGGCMENCQQIAKKVAEKVRKILPA